MARYTTVRGCRCRRSKKNGKTYCTKMVRRKGRKIPVRCKKGR